LVSSLIWLSLPRFWNHIPPYFLCPSSFAIVKYFIVISKYSYLQWSGFPRPFFYNFYPFVINIYIVTSHDKQNYGVMIPLPLNLWTNFDAYQYYVHLQKFHQNFKIATSMPLVLQHLSPKLLLHGCGDSIIPLTTWWHCSSTMWLSNRGYAMVAPKYVVLVPTKSNPNQ